MEVETTSRPQPVQPCVEPSRDPFLGSRTALDNVSSLDDYLASHQPVGEAAPKRPNKQKDSTDRSGPPVPVALGARSSTNTIELNEKCQFFGIGLPDFEFAFEGSTGGGWSVRMEFLGHILDEKGPFASKQVAKEALSAKAVAVISDLEAQGKLKKPGKSNGKRTGSGGEGAEETKKEPGPNYVGQLIEFQRANGHSQPTFSDYQLGLQFSCIVSVDGCDSSFGSTDQLSTSKKAARQHAAGLAVQHFKDEGLWPSTSTDVGGIRKKKVAAAAQSPHSLVSGNPTPGSPESAHGAVPSSSSSYASQVPTLAVALGLPAPEYRIAPEDPKAPGFHSVSCHFRDAGAHAGPIGEVRHVFGKKKAKEECARLTVAYLTAERERRREHARRAMAGAGGEGDVPEAAAEGGGVVLRAGEAGRDGSVADALDSALERRQIELLASDNADVDDDDDDMPFEDAVEELARGDV